MYLPIVPYRLCMIKTKEKLGNMKTLDCIEHLLTLYVLSYFS